MGYIYKITNTANGKVYIGQTVRPLKERFKDHCKGAFKESYNTYQCKLQRAMRKYGREKFVIEEVERCDDSSLDEREQYWIQHFNSVECGYNISLGGGGYRKYTDEEILKAWDQGLSSTQISEQVGINTTLLSMRLHELGIPREEISKRQYDSIKKKVYRYDLDGNFLEEFSSYAETTANHYYAVVSVVDKIGRSAYGSMWRSYKTDHIEPYCDCHRRREAHQYTMDGEYVTSYKSATDAAHAMNVSLTSFGSAIRGKSKTCCGYRWSYEKVDRLPPLKRWERSA